MEANFFRFLCAELSATLMGRRINKVFGPTPGLWVFKLQNSGAPLHLHFRPAKSAGHLFLSSAKPVNPQTAPAMAMWLRKRTANRRIIGLHQDWPGLRLALELTPGKFDDDRNYLVLDCRTGLELVGELDAAFDQQPEWPALEDVIDDGDIWREYPQISPPLRKALCDLPEEQALSLFFKIATGEVNAFYLHKTGNGLESPLAWPVGDSDERFDSALDAANAFGERTLFPMLEVEEDKPQATLLKRARKKIKRNLAKLDEEEARLNRLAAEQIKAEALQAELYRFKDQEGLESVDVTHPEHGPMTVELNPFLSPLENMERYFKQAAKAHRGFTHIHRRRQELERQLAQAEDGTLEMNPVAGHAIQPDGPAAIPKRYRGLAVALFKSSDGFTILRGKSKEANHHMLSKAASPFDYWFHADTGPSSHVILKRDYPGQTVPETSLTEAAILCGLRSHSRDDGKADIMYAQVKDVRKVKGFHLGQVVVDQREGTLRVELDPTLEDKLLQK